jgi:hypothetical protein
MSDSKIISIKTIIANNLNYLKELFATISNMTNKFTKGDFVYVPRIRGKMDLNTASAIMRVKIVEINGRSAKVILPTGELSEFISTSAMTNEIGVFVVEIGDYESEETTLHPLMKSVQDFFDLLLAGDEVVYRTIRSLDELSYFWKEHDNYKNKSHIILIGHGKDNAIRFGNKWISPEEINDALMVEGLIPKHIISLCCETGKADFAKKISELPICKSVIAPFHSIHALDASQFCQTYFDYAFLHGRTLGVAFKNARKVTFTPSFRMWENGKMR